MPKALPKIQGHNPDSIQEVWLAEALEYYGLDFIFQYEIAGGLRMRGGLIVDFHLILKEQAIEYYGDYWHEDELNGDDALRLAALRDYYNGSQNVFILWEHEADQRSEIFAWVKANIL